MHSQTTSWSRKHRRLSAAKHPRRWRTPHAEDNSNEGNRPVQVGRRSRCCHVELHRLSLRSMSCYPVRPAYSRSWLERLSIALRQGFRIGNLTLQSWQTEIVLQGFVKPYSKFQRKHCKVPTNLVLR